MASYILAIDQGTTSSRAILFDKEGKAVASNRKEISLRYPHQGWVEADPIEIYQSVLDVIFAVLKNVNASFDDIISIGITNQRESTIVWEKESGKPVYPAIIWQSRETSEICEKLKKYNDVIKEKTGLIINPYFSASKIRFILDHIKNGQIRAENGELLFGTVDSWLIYNLTKRKVHVSDITNASRTLLFNIHSCKWDDELLKIFNIPKVMLPEVKPCSGDFGVASVLSDNVNIMGVAGDQEAALFGHQCFDKGEIKNTYGTGCFLLLNTGKEIVKSKNGLLSTIAWKLNNEVTYALEGSVFIGGAAVQWLRDELNLIKTAPESEFAAKKVENSGGVYFVPAFVGLGAPYWDDDVRGAFFGLTRASTKYHLARAVLEGIAFECFDVFEAMKEDSGLNFKSIKVDGGASDNNYLMQFQSDITNMEIQKSKLSEMTALGVCYFAGLASNIWPSLDEIKKLNKSSIVFKPTMERKLAKKIVDNYHQAVNSARSFKTK